MGRATKRTFFIQTTGGASGIVPDVKLLVELCEEFPNFGYIKEEYKPVIERMTELAAHRPAVKGVFSGNAGVGMLYEMRLGFDGTMPGAPYANLYAQIWDSYQSGDHEKARDLFSKLLLMTNVDRAHPRNAPIHHETARSLCDQVFRGSRMCSSRRRPFGN